MALLKSENLGSNFKAPDFQLKSVEDLEYSLSSFEHCKLLVIMFICNHCPYVKAIEDRILALEREFRGQSVQWVGICANDPTDYPDDAPQSLLERWQKKNYGFPYLIDETQQIAKAYGAVCTPDLYVFSQDRVLAYHGRLDDNWQYADKVTHRDLAEAIKALLAGSPQAPNSIPSMGCSIKWKKSASL